MLCQVRSPIFLGGKKKKNLFFKHTCIHCMIQCDLSNTCEYLMIFEHFQYVLTLQNFFVPDMILTTMGE